MSATETIARRADRQPGPLPATPVFFASRLVDEDPETKVVEYCAIDSANAVRLMVTVAWNAEPARPGRWTPTSPALAAVLLIDQLLEQERVIIDHHVEDEVLQPLRLGMRDLDLIEMHDILDRRDLQLSAPDLDDEVKLLRFDQTRPDNAYGDALLLKACWSFADEHLRDDLFIERPGPLPLLPPLPSRTPWLVEALLIQALVASVLWLLLSL